MLICYHNQAPLPQNDLVYLAFQFALHETVAEIELSPDLEDDEDYMPAGFLATIPFLQPVPLDGQQVARFQYIGPEDEGPVR